ALLPGAVTGTGATAVIVRSTKEFNAVVKGQHRGDSNFIVELVGTGDTSGREGLFNEIGAFGGETVVDIPEGRMLLSVQANGPWTLAVSESTAGGEESPDGRWAGGAVSLGHRATRPHPGGRADDGFVRRADSEPLEASLPPTVRADR